MIRLLARLVTVAGLLAAALLVPVVSGAPAGTAQAADLTRFDPGNIISDAVFFDSRSMDAKAVQAFLDAKGAACYEGEMPCLKDYEQDTVDQAADAYCDGYRGARGESAATIITKVAVSCGVSPRVLLVLLQKEQGLVRTANTTYAYTHATGFGCPDTAGCDPQFNGIVVQIYFAARQYQRYAAGILNNYKPGMYHDILYSPNADCGSSRVFVENQATAGLYNYTPYQPNAAALKAGYAAVNAKTDPDGAACAAYGNRNFYSYFTDWFGSTQSSAATAIFDKYNDLGGSDGFLGEATSGYLCGLTGKGCFQNYEGGAIYYSPATGAHFIRGEIAGRWGENGWETGDLGYPTTDELCTLTGGGCYQDFQYGKARIYWSGATGAHLVQGKIRTLYTSTGGTTGVLGFPTREQVCGLTRSGCFQDFTGGSVYDSPTTGTHYVRGAIRALWGDNGWETGAFGYPTSDELCTLAGRGCYQDFQYQRTRVYWSGDTGAHFVRGQIRTLYAKKGGTQGALRFPTSDEVCGLTDGGCAQHFQGGHIYFAPAFGAHAVTGKIYAAWKSRGLETGKLGYPVADRKTTSTGASQRFEGGTLTWNEKTGKVTLS